MRIRIWIVGMVSRSKRGAMSDMIPIRAHSFSRRRDSIPLRYTISRESECSPRKYEL
jgi:hypothetical protein